MEDIQTRNSKADGSKNPATVAKSDLLTNNPAAALTNNPALNIEFARIDAEVLNMQHLSDWQEAERAKKELAASIAKHVMEKSNISSEMMKELIASRRALENLKINHTNIVNKMALEMILEVK